MSRPKRGGFNSLGDKLGRSGFGQRPPRGKAVDSKFAESLTKLSLTKLLNAYQMSTGATLNVIREEIIKRRQDGRVKICQGVPIAQPFDTRDFGLNPQQHRNLMAMIAICVKGGFLQADNAIGGAIVLRQVKKSISPESVLLKLSEDITSVPQGAVVYFAVDVVPSVSYGVILHYDHDDFVVIFT